MRVHAALLSVLLVLTGSGLALPIHVPSDPAHPGIGLPLLAPPLLSDMPAAWSVAVDSQGNVILGIADDNGQGKVQKYDSLGHLIWQDVHNGDYTVTVTVDPQDNIITNGHAGLYKYSSGGKLQWTGGSAWAVALTTDAQGNIYAAADEGTNVDWLHNRAVVYKLTPSGVTLWRMDVSVPGTPDGDIAQSIAVSPDGYVALTTNAHTVSLDPNGTLLWRVNGAGYRVAIDGQHNVYTGGVTQDLLLGLVDHGYLTKFTTTGSTAWTISQPSTYVVFADGDVVAVDYRIIGGLPNPLSGVTAWTVDAYDTNTGLWQWGFKHVTGTWCCFQALISGNAYYRPGYLAITGTGYGVFDSPLYKMDGLAHVCDATPLISPPDLARACVFTPV